MTQPTGIVSITWQTPDGRLTAWPYEFYFGLRGQPRVGLVDSVGRVSHWDVDQVEISSVTQILPGTVAYCGGPHPQVIHQDEVELMDPEVWSQASKAALEDADAEAMLGSGHDHYGRFDG